MTWWPLIKVLPQKTNFHFVKYARLAAALSVVLCVASIVACFYPGLNMGIDFRGGASMEVSKPAGQVIALVELDEGVRMMSNIVDVEPLPENLELGMRLAVRFEPRGDQFLPVFTPETRS